MLCGLEAVSQNVIVLYLFCYFRIHKSRSTYILRFITVHIDEMRVVIFCIYYLLCCFERCFLSFFIGCASIITNFLY
jgi:hypothetical protein